MTWNETGEELFRRLESSTLAGQLRRAAEQPLGVRFLDRTGEPTFLSYKEIEDRARAVAGGLQRRGARPGDRIPLILPTGPAFFDAFFGAVLAGAVPVPLYPPVRLGRLDEYHRRTGAMIRHVGARLVLTDRRIRQILGQTVLEAGQVVDLVTIEGLPRADYEEVASTPDDLAFIQFSSGTTMEPKPIVLTHRQVLAGVGRILDAILTSHPEGPDLVHGGVSWLPLYHDMGLVGCVLTALAHPGPLTLIPPEVFVTRPAVWLQAISRYKGTISPAPNFAYALCVDRIKDQELEGVDLSSWRMALNGAEPVSPAVLERFIERFRPFGLRPEALTPVYGLAEATLAVSFSDVGRPFHWQRFERRELTERGEARLDDEGQPLVSLGRPLPGFSLRIVDREGRSELGSDTLGRVLVKGPSIMKGYYGNPEATAATMADGWLDTGDLGFIHQGELYLYGREKDIIILRGRNLAPQDIEQSLDGLDGLRAGCSAAFGVFSDDSGSELLVVLAERARDFVGDEDELARRAAGRISRRTGLVAHQIVILSPGTLPRTSSGKIRRSQARELFLEDGLSPPERVTPLRMMGMMVRSGWSYLRRRISTVPPTTL